MSVIRDRVRGILLGLAVGDRNGGPIRMAVRLAESLVGWRRFDPQDILDRYLAWWRDDAFDTGPTTAQVLSLIDGGMDAAEAVERVHEQAGGLTAGCNPAHRCAPLAMAPFLPDEEVAGCALREARLTHHHPLAGDLVAAVAVLCRASIRGEPWDDAVSRAAAGRLGPTRQVLDLESPAPLSPGGYAPEVLRAIVPSKIRLINATGKTATQPPSGSPFITLNLGPSNTCGQGRSRSGCVGSLSSTHQEIEHEEHAQDEEDDARSKRGCRLSLNDGGFCGHFRVSDDPSLQFAAHVGAHRPPRRKPRPRASCCGP
jgi:hypothetical protein